MRIENNYTTFSNKNNKYLPPFEKAYINMHTLNNYYDIYPAQFFQNGRTHIINALKDKNTPLRKFISEVINTKEFENNMGDCYISFSRENRFGKAAGLFDIITFTFPKKQEQAIKHTFNMFKTVENLHKLERLKESIANNLAKGTTFDAGFRDYIHKNPYTGTKSEQNGAQKLAEYIQSSEIVEHLKMHIEKYKNKYIL